MQRSCRTGSPLLSVSLYMFSPDLAFRNCTQLRSQGATEQRSKVSCAKRSTTSRALFSNKSMLVINVSVSKPRMGHAPRFPLKIASRSSTLKHAISTAECNGEEEFWIPFPCGILPTWIGALQNSSQIPGDDVNIILDCLAVRNNRS